MARFISITCISARSSKETATTQRILRGHGSRPHKEQIRKSLGLSKQDGYAIVPLKIYVRNGYAKLLLGLGKGKRQYDKRADAAKKDAQRDIQRAREKQKIAR